jgi:hypothetical protein
MILSWSVAGYKLGLPQSVGFSLVNYIKIDNFMGEGNRGCERNCAVQS